MRNSRPSDYGSEGRECVLHMLGYASAYYCAVVYTRVGKECVLVYIQAVPSFLQ